MKKSYSAIVEYPPFSINKAWQGRRFMTPEYKKWRAGLKEMLENEVEFRVDGWIELEINFYVKQFGRLDGDNLVKGFADSLVDAGIIEDDRKIVHYSIWKHKPKDGKEKIKFEIKRYGY